MLSTQVALVLIVVGGVLVFEKLFNKDFDFYKKETNKASLLIDFDNMTRRFEGEVSDGMTILDALNASVAAGKIKIRYTVDNDNNTSVDEINDHQAVNNKSFYFYTNGEIVSEKNLNRTPVYSGDKIVIKLE